ncbi:hypothetical protein U1Q18_003062 [Sarracenia purpurea var. burkii]
MHNCQILLLLADKAATGVGLCAAAGGPNVAGVEDWVAVKVAAKVDASADEGLRVVYGFVSPFTVKLHQRHPGFW